VERFSVPFRRRPMLERCVQTLKPATAAANQNWAGPNFSGVKSGRSQQERGRETPSASEARET
jgi:hypothetical protein